MLDPIANVWRVDVFLEPGDDMTWVYRRAEAGATRRLLRRRELVLLFKAKATRPKDELDFATALPRLDRRWLSDLLARAHPNHPWFTLAKA